MIVVAAVLAAVLAAVTACAPVTAAGPSASSSAAPAVTVVTDPASARDSRLVDEVRSAAEAALRRLAVSPAPLRTLRVELVAGTPAGTPDTVALAVGGARPHVAVDATAWAGLSRTGRTALLTHDAAHLAVGSPDVALPLWLEEGVAEHVAWAGTGVPSTVVAAEAYATTDMQRLPTRLPGDAAFAGPDRAATYGHAYLVTGCLERLAGPDAPVRVLLRASELARASVEPGEAVATALADVTGVSPADLVDCWHDTLRSAGPARTTGATTAS